MRVRALPPQGAAALVGEPAMLGATAHTFLPYLPRSRVAWGAPTAL